MLISYRPTVLRHFFAFIGGTKANCRETLGTHENLGMGLVSFNLTDKIRVIRFYGVIDNVLIEDD